ncbi:HTH-type transcriptional regulator BenM [Bradyrhizobium ivorense]|uniref:HTH-type transcriptional regulator BenM n=1 Tax=Bradyrhizobium ivorense TaxID=2511166 RepID=A0A508TA56_9BRAD|nr:LysR family transcriptional regulator [Bradyrhizobium ivorense]VIO72392.1 HTH-type transcriptional regulator BenM [Bradyrhizobium ivorense]
MLSLRQLQQFLAVADSMSFRQAADRLNMAQPPLTAAIRQMEEQLGVRLLERTNRITGLTAAGQVLRDEARRTIAQAERTIALTRRAGAGLTGSLRIGFVATAVRHIVPTLIANFRDTHPDVALELMEAPSARQVAALLDDRLDLGIVALPLPTGAEREIATRTVLRSELVAALPERHALAREPTAPLALAALAHEPWILFPANEGPGLHDRIVGACAAAGFAPEVAQRAVQMETIVGLVAAGLGVALVPALFKTTGWSSVVFRAIDGTPVPYEVALAWRRNDGSAALAALLASYAARNPGE